MGEHGELVTGGLAYSVRAIRCIDGYQVLVSFEFKEPHVKWHGLMAGIDMNPEGIACTIASGDGNRIATRFLGDNRLISASASKRKWVLENLVNRMLKWCLLTHNCNAVAIENLELRGAYDFGEEELQALQLHEEEDDRSDKATRVEDGHDHGEDQPSLF